MTLEPLSNAIREMYPDVSFIPMLQELAHYRISATSSVFPEDIDHAPERCKFTTDNSFNFLSRCLFKITHVNSLSAVLLTIWLKLIPKSYFLRNLTFYPKKIKLGMAMCACHFQ
jgi:hypothetical protein